jgi:hypothetical protein
MARGSIRALFCHFQSSDFSGGAEYQNAKRTSTIVCGNRRLALAPSGPNKLVTIKDQHNEQDTRESSKQLLIRRNLSFRVDADFPFTLSVAKAKICHVDA